MADISIGIDPKSEDKNSNILILNPLSDNDILLSSNPLVAYIEGLSRDKYSEFSAFPKEIRCILYRFLLFEKANVVISNFRAIRLLSKSSERFSVNMMVQEKGRVSADIVLNWRHCIIYVCNIEEKISNREGKNIWTNLLSSMLKMPSMDKCRVLLYDPLVENVVLLYECNDHIYTAHVYNNKLYIVSMIRSSLIVYDLITGLLTIHSLSNFHGDNVCNKDTKSFVIDDKLIIIYGMFFWLIPKIYCISLTARSGVLVENRGANIELLKYNTILSHTELFKISSEIRNDTDTSVYSFKNKIYYYVHRIKEIKMIDLSDNRCTSIQVRISENSIYYNSSFLCYHPSIYDLKEISAPVLVVLYSNIRQRGTERYISLISYLYDTDLTYIKRHTVYVNEKHLIDDPRHIRWANIKYEDFLRRKLKVIQV